MKISFDVSTMTLRELEDLEDVTGVPASTLGKGQPPTAKQMRAIIWISLRRNDPEFTFEQAGDIVLSDIEFADPPAGAGPVASPNGSRPSATSTAASRRKRSGV